MKTTILSRCWYVLLFVFTLFVGYSNDVLAYSDLGDAPASYGEASHYSPLWQRLGNNWDAEDVAKTEDTSDDGVFWSVDGGQTWGHADITAGQTVKFKFDMYKQEWGRHDFDAIKVWLDWNGDGDFTDLGELILQDLWNFKSEPGYTYGDGFAGISKSFYTDLIVPVDAHLGDTWLRAQVVCNADIGNNLNNLTPDGHWYQGEVEDWKIKINPVPEPSTLILLGAGLAGVAFMRKRSRK